MAQVLFINEFWSLHIKIKDLTPFCYFFYSAESFYHIVSLKYLDKNMHVLTTLKMDGQNSIHFVTFFVSEQHTLRSGSTR